jgi:hypothetical protein
MSALPVWPEGLPNVVVPRVWFVAAELYLE